MQPIFSFGTVQQCLDSCIGCMSFLSLQPQLVWAHAELLITNKSSATLPSGQTR